MRESPSVSPAVICSRSSTLLSELTKLSLYELERLLNDIDLYEYCGAASPCSSTCWTSCWRTWKEPFNPARSNW